MFNWPHPGTRDLGEFSKAMQTLDYLSGLHNCLKSSQPSSMRLCKHGKRVLLLKYVTKKFLLVGSSVKRKQILCFVYS